MSACLIDSAFIEAIVSRIWTHLSRSFRVGAYSSYVLSANFNSKPKFHLQVRVREVEMALIRDFFLFSSFV